MKYIVSSEFDGQRVDRFLSSVTQTPRNQILKVFDDGIVQVQGRPVRPSYKVSRNEVVVVNALSTAQETDTRDVLVPQDIPLEILYHDEHLVVINKPPGLVVYPAAGHASGTLMNALRFRFGPLKSVGGPLRPGVVHRLDKETSGVMVVALSDESYYSLVEQFRAKTTSRSYRALIYGTPAEESGVIQASIGRSRSDRKKMSTMSRRGKEAETHWECIAHYRSATLIRAVLQTGRTHQIRVHLSSLGHPVLGDKVYGHKTFMKFQGRVLRFDRQMLHAAELGFTHPVTGERMSFESPIPQDMMQAIEDLRL